MLQGEEKLIRVFDIPTIVLDGLHQLCNYQNNDSIDLIIENKNNSVINANHQRIYKAYIP